MKITPEQVREAYSETNLLPVRGRYVSLGCACPLSVLYKKEHPDKHITRNDVLDWAGSKWSMKYCLGFIQGYDNKDISVHGHESSQKDEKTNSVVVSITYDGDLIEGYKDGQNVLRHIKPTNQ